MNRFRALLRGAARLLLKALRVVFILLLVILPVPVASLFVALLGPARRNLPAQVLKEKK